MLVSFLRGKSAKYVRWCGIVPSWFEGQCESKKKKEVNQVIVGDIGGPRIKSIGLVCIVLLLLFVPATWSLVSSVDGPDAV